MIDPGKLTQLEGGQKRRKLALTLGALERDIDGVPEKGNEYSYKSIARADYVKKIVEICLKDPQMPSEDAKILKNALEEIPFDEKRSCNLARNTMLKIIGTFPAEWDLIIAPHPEVFDENGIVKQRDFFEGVSVYAEDIRSPFNLGSIFRTAEAMGAENVFVSPIAFFMLFLPYKPVHIINIAIFVGGKKSRQISFFKFFFCSIFFSLI